MSKVRRYQRGSQDPQIEEEQTTQGPNDRGQKDKQWSKKPLHRKLKIE